MADKNDTISYAEYQKLSDEEKQNYETHWLSDGKSGIATRKGAKLPEVKPIIPIIPVTGTKSGPSTSSTTATVKDTAAGDKTEAKAKTETADKANQMSDSSKAKTETAATGKFINPFQKEKEAADKDVEDASILLDRVKQLADKIAKKHADAINWNTFSPPAIHSFLNELLKIERDEKILAKELNIDISSLSENTETPTITPLRLKKLNEMLTKAAEERLADAKTKQQESQANYTKVEEMLAAKRKAEEEAAKRKAEEILAAKRKAEEEAAKRKAEEEAQANAEKDGTEDPLEKAEELEQPRAPADIKKFSNDLNRFVIQAYLNGDFGKKSNPNAIATMGFFILDKLGSALVNASQVARGMSPSAKSQWSSVLDKQTELLGKRITSEWFLSLPKDQQEALYRSGVVQPVTGDDIYGSTDPAAVEKAKERDALKNSKLSQEQKGVAQSNINALLARKSELQTLISQLRSDQGWEVYAQAMNAVVGTAKGLSSLGITDSSNSSSNKGFSDTLSADVSTGKVTAAFVSGSISNSSTWNNSSAKALSKSNSLNQDALALSKFESGESYANATREAKKAANEQLIKRLEGQIEIIDKCIDSWGKDLDL